MPPRAKKEVTPEVDPFAPEQDNEPVGDEAQTDTRPWELQGDETDVNSAETSEKKVIVVGAGEGKVVGTIKGGRDYDEPWIVFHCDTLQELVDQATDYELLGQAMDALQKASKKFRDFRPSEGASTAPAPAQNGSQGQGQRTQGKPASATDGPLGPQYCNHGKKKFWSKFDEEKGKLVQLYFCPADRNDPNKCKAQSVN